MEYIRKNPQPVKAFQYINYLGLLKICREQGLTVIVNSNGFFVNEQKLNIGDWVVIEGNSISVHSSDKFEILFERVKPEYQIPSLAELA